MASGKSTELHSLSPGFHFPLYDLGQSTFAFLDFRSFVNTINHAYFHRRTTRNI